MLKEQFLFILSILQEHEKNRMNKKLFPENILSLVKTDMPILLILLHLQTRCAREDIPNLDKSHYWTILREMEWVLLFNRKLDQSYIEMYYT